MLQIIRRTPDEEQLDWLDMQMKDEYHQYQPGDHTAITHQQQQDGRFDFIAFRQPSMKEYLQTNANELIGDAVQAKVGIFNTLCNIICDRTPNGAQSRKALEEYAVTKFVEHLVEIEFESVNEKQTGEIIEGLARVLTNENDANVLFEGVAKSLDESATPFDLYDNLDETTRKGRTLMQNVERWARKMTYHGADDLSERANAWLLSINKDASNVLQPLAIGHLRSWFGQVTFDQATVSYNLAYRALRPVSLSPLYSCTRLLTQNSANWSESI
jgi:hypothetical protein